MICPRRVYLKVLKKKLEILKQEQKRMAETPKMVPWIPIGAPCVGKT